MVSNVDISLMHRLADVAGEEIRPFFRTIMDIDAKEDATPVTLADRNAESAMRKLIEAEAGADGIHGEEFGVKNGASGRQWVLDPIDGTTAFLAGRPIFGTLIALLEDGFPVLGMIDQPILGERWLGAVGQGTTLNGQTIHARSCPDLRRATIATTGPHYFSVEQGDRFMALAGQTDHKRMVMGGDCYNYACLAGGHIDIVAEAALKLHDYAALVPIVEGAGGIMCDWAGEPLHAQSDGTVLALGDPARLEDVLEVLG
ncbi:histidinol-phosphate phosphatase [Aurantiacibacter atlanticus]|uniref:Histidinol-phosphate phosphatase n=1 Tax=Aurantiacibacter atlanticus TaxID=1648404 RepID=A0A0H4VEE6_9SPHN|nr:inositol monophosphatase family protein [Aurantiacibacter atlanticus]AKQ41191.1 histidinol-phosphate phosphatase [Aurantiacibacter atlanticus]MDF1835235.1 inositol monophosphatase family protein [Alteraurantiacibacter sp. bin_em_oilr2.035]